MHHTFLRAATGIGLGAMFLTSCKPDLTPDAPQAGTADFSRYVAVGNSLTAGFADNSLTRASQENSYPALLARQFALTGGGSFKQPLLQNSGAYPGPQLMLALKPDCLGVSSLSPVPAPVADTSGNAAYIGAAGPYNNLGVPGIRCIDFLLPTYGSRNPYSQRFFSTLATNPTANPAQEVKATVDAIKPTFFSLWIGNNDVLGYATSGGSGKSSGGTFFDQNSISSTALFQTAFDSVFRVLTANGAKGVVMGIPDVTAIPYFTTVPVKGLALSRQGQVDSLNAAYQPLIAANLVNRFELGPNYWIIQDTSLPAQTGRLRSIKEGEYLTLTLPQDSLKCGGWGSRKPIPIQYVLDLKEVNAVRTATTTFNNYMKAAANAKNLPFVDVGAYLKTVASGLTFNGVNYNTAFVTGGTFSLDGVHLTPRGYALVANYILQAINTQYGSSVPMLDINSYPGVRFPQQP